MRLNGCGELVDGLRAAVVWGAAGEGCGGSGSTGWSAGEGEAGSAFRHSRAKILPTQAHDETCSCRTKDDQQAVRHVVVQEPGNERSCATPKHKHGRIHSHRHLETLQSNDGRWDELADQCEVESLADLSQGRQWLSSWDCEIVTRFGAQRRMWLGSGGNACITAIKRYDAML